MDYHERAEAAVEGGNRDTPENERKRRMRERATQRNKTERRRRRYRKMKRRWKRHVAHTCRSWS